MNPVRLPANVRMIGLVVDRDKSKVSSVNQPEGEPQ